MALQIDESQRIQWAGLYLLKMMEERSFTIDPKGDEQILKPIQEDLYKRGYIEINEQNQWAVTPKGTDILTGFDGRYRRFLKEADVFCAVDLEEGCFAMESYHEFAADDSSWGSFLDQPRWEDLRIAVAEFRGEDPLQYVFMDFVNQGRFGLVDGAWDYDLLLGKVWDEIGLVLNSALRLKNLAFEDEGELVSGEEVMQAVVEQGEEVLARLLQ